MPWTVVVGGALNAVPTSFWGFLGESHEMMMQTANEIGVLGFDAVKLHNLYAVKGTPLGQQVIDGKIQMMERDDLCRNSR